MSTAGISAGGMRERLRDGAADAERENEREGLDPLHQTQLTISTFVAPSERKWTGVATALARASGD